MYNLDFYLGDLTFNCIVSVSIGPILVIDIRNIVVG